MEKIKNHLSDSFHQTRAGNYSAHLWYVLVFLMSLFLPVFSFSWCLAVILITFILDIIVSRYFWKLHFERYHEDSKVGNHIH